MNKKIVITGGYGFLGRNLYYQLIQDDTLTVERIGRQDTQDQMMEKLKHADAVFHLAGSNRPLNTDEYEKVNRGFTATLLSMLEESGHFPLIVYASSTQATRDNLYGQSKKAAEDLIRRFSEKYNSPAVIFRLTNVFGKWSKPNYNSAVATFCHHIARDLDIRIDDPGARLNLLYVDDVARCFRHILDKRIQGFVYEEAEPVHSTVVGDLVDILRGFRNSRHSLYLPDLNDPLTRKLYSTYVSFLPEEEFAYNLTERVDNRGKLAEILKSSHFGQIFFSTTRPGITRGNHYHHSKVEKFCVLQGNAVVRFRHIENDRIIEYHVSGDQIKVIDIPPGYTHNIENIGYEDMLVLFWANEIFDPENPDTKFLEV